ncbi:hypothetical protein [Sporolactobacillus inulinus]|uniref:Uncharacterized protein n=1 Tax=Sporolactobacillus inulinus TaxID=2078 RepID=A0A4Y1Z9Z5_9BACL|nr:hypothetical protein [Sporolactobacillus inulinus]GAY75872.1 hypothetical protein NBRC111894_1426 [Sporolactobacillus inulinus]
MLNRRFGYSLAAGAPRAHYCLWDLPWLVINRAAPQAGSYLALSEQGLKQFASVLVF